MIPALARFVSELRREGLRVSQAELLDATRAVEALGLADRARFKRALCATLVKNARALELFERAFDRFFVPPRREPRGKQAGVVAGAGERPGQRAAAGSAAPRRAPPAKDEPAPARQKHPVPSSRERARMIVDEVRNARRAGRLRIVRLERAKDANAREPGRAPRDLRRQELSRAMSSDEEAAIARLVPQLLEDLRLRSGRRIRAAHRGRLFARRLLRENLAHGGIPFVLPFRRPRPRRPRVVLLVDVSFSVARAAGFFLRMAGEFLRIGRGTRVVAFVDRPVDATAAIGKWLARGKSGTPRASTPAPPARRGRRPGQGIRVAGASFADVLEGLSGLNLDAPSDYGRALHGLLDSALAPRGRDTVLVILGDARTNRFDPLPWALEEIARRCRFVLWLVSEPEARWGSGDSALASYLPAVDVAVEAHDLAGLGRGIAELVRRL